MLALVERKEEMILAWDNSDGSGINVTFLEGKVTKTSKMMLKQGEKKKVEQAVNTRKNMQQGVMYVLF